MKRYLVPAILTLITLNSCKKEYPIIEEPIITQTSPSEIVSGFITTNTTWTSNNIYILSGKVVVTNGATLTIEPGTIIKGKQGTGTLASSLIIAKGAKINAAGTSFRPIIFTSILDNITVGQIMGTNLDEGNKGKWGGLVILGDAPVSDKGGNTQGHAEGIPATDAFGSYGGNNPTDNSGTISYVSIRHGGTTIAPGKEINGLTLAGVGSGTTIENVEIVANEDDAIEFFGGTVNVTNVIATFFGDDGVDIDQNYAGTITNALIVQNTGSDEAFEIDGPEGSTYTNGSFTINNATAETTDGVGKAGDLKSQAQGTLNNILWKGYSTWLRVRENYDASNNCANKTDAYDHYISGSLKVTNSVFLNANSLDACINAYTDEQTCSSNITSGINDALTTKLSSENNQTTGTAGADFSKFSNWTWYANKGKL